MSEETEKEVTEKKNVNSHVIMRNERGRFLPGYTANPLGKPRKAPEHAGFLAAINRTMPPNRVESLLEQAIAISMSTHSWRGIVAVLEFCANYQVGKPIQRSITANATSALTEVLESLRIVDANND